MILKKTLQLMHTGDEYVELHATSKGIPRNPTRKSDTAKLTRIALLVDLMLEEQPISKMTPPFITRMKTMNTNAGIVSRGI